MLTLSVPLTVHIILNVQLHCAMFAEVAEVVACPACINCNSAKQGCCTAFSLSINQLRQRILLDY